MGRGGGDPGTAEGLSAGGESILLMLIRLTTDLPLSDTAGFRVIELRRGGKSSPEELSLRLSGDASAPCGIVCPYGELGFGPWFEEGERDGPAAGGACRWVALPVEARRRERELRGRGVPPAVARVDLGDIAGGGEAACLPTASSSLGVSARRSGYDGAAR